MKNIKNTTREERDARLERFKKQRKKNNIKKKTFEI